jgi:hypothetical protein
MTGSEDSAFDLAPLRSRAAEYVLQPGDFLFIPTGDFHVLGGDGFSATLGLSLFPATNRSTVSDAVDSLLGHFELRDYSHIRSPDESSAIVEEFLPKGASLQGRLIDAIRENSEILRSNGYITTRPAPRTRRSIPRHEIVYATEACPIILAGMRDGRMTLLVRGRSVVLKTHSSIAELLRLMHGPDGVPAGVLLDLLDGEWDPAACEAFLGLLYEFKGVCLSGEAFARCHYRSNGLAEIASAPS